MLTSKQGREINKLIKSECANYFEGDCILLDCGCPQMISGELCCRYFENSVLPLDVELEHDLIGSAIKKNCKRCKKKFVTKSNATQFCPFCSKIMAREKARERKQKQRDQSPTHVTQ